MRKDSEAVYKAGIEAPPRGGLQTVSIESPLYDEGRRSAYPEPAEDQCDQQPHRGLVLQEHEEEHGLSESHCH